MKKKDIIKNVSKKTGMKLDESKVLVDAMLEIIMDSLANKEKVTLHYFGSFTVRYRNEVKWKNPGTEKYQTIGGKNIVFFRPSNSLIDKLNN